MNLSVLIEYLLNKLFYWIFIIFIFLIEFLSFDFVVSIGGT